LVRKHTKRVEYALHHELFLLFGQEILFSKKCFWKRQRMCSMCGITLVVSYSKALNKQINKRKLVEQDLLKRLALYNKLYYG